MLELSSRSWIHIEKSFMMISSVRQWITELRCRTSCKTPLGRFGRCRRSSTSDLHFDSNPVFCEAYFDDDNIDMNLMIELNGHWFYKAPGVKCVDMMSAFFKKAAWTEQTDMTLENICTTGIWRK